MVDFIVEVILIFIQILGYINFIKCEKDDHFKICFVMRMMIMRQIALFQHQHLKVREVQYLLNNIILQEYY